MAVEIEYYLTSNREWLIDYAASIEKATGEKVEWRGNSILFPPSIGIGRYEVHELADGLALWITDCVYNTDVKVTRRNILGNDHFSLMFNVSGDGVNLHKQNGGVVETGKDLANAIFFSSQSVGIDYDIKKGTHVKSVGVLFHHDWANKMLERSGVPLRQSRSSAIVNNMPVQFTTNMDLKVKAVVEELFTCKLPHYLKLKYFEGIAIQLFALFLRNVAMEETGEERLLSSEAIRIVKFKEWLDMAIAGKYDVPSLDEAVAKCYMSKISFIKLFQMLYEKNYAEYVRIAKIKRAANLIAQGTSVSDAGHEIGYINLGHFARVFREEIGMSPKKYQKHLIGK